MTHLSNIAEKIRAQNEEYIKKEKAKIYSTIKGQDPPTFCATCSDSREGVERFFDDVYNNVAVLRNAGNVIENNETTAGYFAEHTNLEEAVIIGHTNCGAVNATLHLYDSGAVPDESSELRPIYQVIVENKNLLEKLDKEIESYYARRDGNLVSLIDGIYMRLDEVLDSASQIENPQTKTEKALYELAENIRRAFEEDGGREYIRAELRNALISELNVDAGVDTLLKMKEGGLAVPPVLGMISEVFPIFGEPGSIRAINYNGEAVADKRLSYLVQGEYF